MAKSKVLLSVVAEGKNIKIVQGQVEKLAKSTNKAGKSSENLGKSAGTADRNLKGAAGASANATKNFSKMSQGIGGTLVPAYATLAANIFAVTAAFNFFKDAGNLATLQRGQEAYASATGVAMRSLANEIVAATDAQIKFTDASQAAAIGTAAGLSTDQLVRLGEAAKNTSLILGRDVTDSFNRLVRGVTKAEPELLDELGIILRLKDATEAYGLQVGKAADQLTPFERSQAVANDVLTQAEDKYGRILAIVEPSVNNFNQLAVAFDEIINRVKLFANAVAGPFAAAVTQFPSLGIAILGLFGKGVLQAALPGLRTIGETAKEAAEVAEQSFKKAERRVKAYDRVLARASKTTEKLKTQQGALKTLAKLGGGGPDDPGFTGKGFTMLREGKGDQLTARQLNGMRAAIKATNKLSDDQKKKWIANLDIMVAATKKSTKQIETAFVSTGQKIGLSFKRWQSVAVGAIAQVKIAAAAFASFATTALSALGWISLVATLGATVYQYFKAKEATDETSEALARQTERLKSLNEEFKNFNEIQNVITEDGGALLQYYTALGNRISQVNISGQTELIERSIQDLSDSVLLTQEKLAKQRKDLIEGDIGVIAGLRNINSSEGLQAQIDQYKDLLENLEEGTRRYESVSKVIKDLENKQKQLAESLEETNFSFGNFLRLSGDPGQQELLKYFEDVSANLEIIQNNFQSAGIDGSITINNYLQTIENLLKASDPDQIKAFFDEFKKGEAAVKEATDLFKNYQQVVKDNATLVQNIRQSFLPKSQNQQAIEALEEEFFTIENLRSEYNGLTDEQQKRYNQAIRDYEFVKQLQEIEVKNLERQRELEVDSVRRLIGQTKLRATIIKRELDLQKIENSRLNILDEQNVIYNQIRENNGVAGKQEIDRLNALDQQLAVLNAQEDSLQRQGDYSAQLVDSINQAVEDGFQSGLNDIITGKEKSFKDAVAKLAVSTLTTIAGTLSRQITESLFQNSFISKLQNAFSVGAQQMSAAIRGEDPTTVTDTDISTNGLSGIGKRIGNFLLGTPTTMRTSVETEAGVDLPESVDIQGTPLETKRIGGIFQRFTTALQDIFSGQNPFLDTLRTVFRFGRDTFSTLFDGVLSIFRGAGGIGGIFSSLPFFAMGGVISNGKKMSGYASGGIATGSTSGYPAMLHGTEAVVPLPDGRSIPVEMMGSSGTNNITVNVAIDNQGNATTDTSQQGANIGNIIAQAVQKELQNQKRAGGILSPYGAA